MKIALLLTSSAVLFTTRVSAFSVVNIINSSSSRRRGNNAVAALGHNNQFRLFSMNMTTTTNTKNTDDESASVSSSRWTPTPSIFGGDYAGQSATFSSLDGTLIPVPDHLVPDSMVEWGQVPSCLECIVSEDLLLLQENDDDDSAGNDDHQRVVILERNTVSVMPEVGCGLDNLDTTKVTERIPVEQYQEFTVGDDVTVSTVFVVEEGKNRHVECVFLTTKTNTRGDNNNNNNHVERTRVRVHLPQENTNQLARSTPIVVTKERQTSQESSRGTIANGGGLDARTVTTLIGKELLAHKPFSDRKAVDLVTLEGKWKKSMSTTVTTHKDNVAAAAETERDNTFWNGALSLGGNIIVRYNNSSSSSSPSCASLEISLIILDSAGAADVPMKRVVVHRLLPETEKDKDNNNNNAGAGATTVHCYEEVKE